MKSWHQRFWENVGEGSKRLAPGCWIWMFGIRKDGYGRCSPGPGGGSRLAHVRAWEQIKGPVPKGLVLDHLCRRRNCVNPSHLEPVTNEENVRRGMFPSSVNARKTHCKRGHLLAGDNVMLRPGKSDRRCRACAREFFKQRDLRPERQAYNKQYRETHKAECHARNQAYYKKNREKILSDKKSEQAKQKRRAREEQNREKTNAQKRALYKKKAESERARNKAWREANPEKYLAIRRAWAEKQRIKKENEKKGHEEKNASQVEI